MRLEFLQLEEILKAQVGSGPVYYWPNPGNWGDGLIRAGTLRFFRDIGLEVMELTPCKRHRFIAMLRRGAVIYGGGGAWNPHYDEGYRTIQRIQNRYRSVIVLPSSYDRPCAFEGVTLFRRDQDQSAQNAPQSIFCHDMAFYLEPLQMKRPTTHGGVAYCFRTDAESAQQHGLPPNNMDLSPMGNHYSDVYPLFEQLARYSTVYTDRLHIAIASCLLGLEVHFVGGSYFKNRAVFEASLQPYFDRVYFYDTADWRSLGAPLEGTAGAARPPLLASCP